jgi:hypothetical protein
MAFSSRISILPSDLSPLTAHQGSGHPVALGPGVRSSGCREQRGRWMAAPLPLVATQQASPGGQNPVGGLVRAPSARFWGRIQAMVSTDVPCRGCGTAISILCPLFLCHEQTHHLSGWFQPPAFFCDHAPGFRRGCAAGWGPSVHQRAHMGRPSRPPLSPTAALSQQQP